MSAECHDCGTDLVYTAEWPAMECPRCTVAAERDRYREALEQIRELTISEWSEDEDNDSLGNMVYALTNGALADPTSRNDRPEET